MPRGRPKKVANTSAATAETNGNVTTAAVVQKDAPVKPTEKAVSSPKPKGRKRKGSAGAKPKSPVRKEGVRSSGRTATRHYKDDYDESSSDEEVYKPVKRSTVK